MVFNATRYFQGDLLNVNSTFDLGKVETLCPKWRGEVPLNSTVAIIHSVNLYGSSPTYYSNLLVAVVILALSTDARKAQSNANMGNKVWL